MSTPQGDFYRWHARVGAALVMLLFVVCVSGTVSVVAEDLAIWERPELWTANTAEVPALDEKLDEVFERGGAEGSAFIGADPEHPIVDFAYRHPDHGFVRLYLDAATGRELGSSRGRTYTAVERLHTNLLAPGPIAIVGRLLVGFAGLVFAVLTVSGLFMHGSWRTLLRARWGKSPRSRAATVHRLGGVAMLPFTGLIALTGAFLGLTLILIALGAAVGFDGDREATVAALGEQLDLGGEEREAGEPAPSRSATELLSSVREPGYELERVEIQHWGHEGGVLIVRERDHNQWRLDGPIRKRTFSLVDGQLLEDRDLLATRSGVARTMLALGPLHFGSFGPKVIHWLYFVFGVLLSGAVLAGLEVWRRRVKDSLAPRRSLAICVGLLVAIAWVGLAARALPPSGGVISGIIPFLGLWLVCSAGYELAWARGVGIADSLRHSALVSAFALPLVELLSAPLAHRPTSVWVVDGALVLTGLALLLTRSWTQEP